MPTFIFLLVSLASAAARFAEDHEDTSAEGTNVLHPGQVSRSVRRAKTVATGAWMGIVV